MRLHKRPVELLLVAERPLFFVPDFDAVELGNTRPGLGPVLAFDSLLLGADRFAFALLAVEDHAFLVRFRGLAFARLPANLLGLGLALGDFLLADQIGDYAVALSDGGLKSAV
jgi:hypothetical protein